MIFSLGVIAVIGMILYILFAAALLIRITVIIFKDKDYFMMFVLWWIFIVALLLIFKILIF